MSQLEAEAVFNLANIEDDDDFCNFQPFHSMAFNPLTKNQPPKQRPKTGEAKINLSRRATTAQTRRQELKKQLRVLQQVDLGQSTPKGQNKVVMSKSLYCMASTPVANQSNGFPSHPIRKQPAQKLGLNRYYNCKENAMPRYSRINPEQLIREDIMKKFKLRESARQDKKQAKINNFLKATMTRVNAVPIFFKRKQHKMKVTLTNLLS